MDSSPNTSRPPPKNNTYSHQSHQSHQSHLPIHSPKNICSKEGLHGSSGSAWGGLVSPKADKVWRPSCWAPFKATHVPSWSDFLGGRRQQRWYGIPPPWTSVGAIQFGGDAVGTRHGKVYVFVVASLCVDVAGLQLSSQKAKSKSRKPETLYQLFAVVAAYALHGCHRYIHESPWRCPRCLGRHPSRPLHLTKGFRATTTATSTRTTTRTWTHTNHMLIVDMCWSHKNIFDHMLNSRRPLPPVILWTQLSKTRGLSRALLPQHDRFPQLPTTWAAFWGCRQHHPRCRQGALLRYPFLVLTDRNALEAFRISTKPKRRQKTNISYIHSNYSLLYVQYLSSAAYLYFLNMSNMS